MNVHAAVVVFIFHTALLSPFYVIQDHLAWLTYHLDEGDGELLGEDEEEEDHGTAE